MISIHDYEFLLCKFNFLFGKFNFQFMECNFTLLNLLIGAYMSGKCWTFHTVTFSCLYLGCLWSYHVLLEFFFARNPGKSPVLLIRTLIRNYSVTGCCTSCAVRIKSGQLRQPEALGISAELKSQVNTMIWIHVSC